MKWMRERKWYLKTMAVGFIGSFFLLFLFYRQAALCFLGAVLGSVCYVRYRIKVQKEQEKWQLMVEFKEAMDSMVSALAAGYSMENAITEAYRDMKLLHSEDTRMMRELWDIQQKISLHQPLDEVLSAFASKSGVEDIITFAQIYATARKSGGNLVKVMKRTAQNISEKMEMLNTANPAGEAAQSLAAQLREQYDAACLPVNCLELTEQDILEILRSVLYEFPVTEACFRMPEWMDVLPPGNETKQQLYALLREQMPSLHRLRDAQRAAQALTDSELLEAADVENVSVDTGAVCYVLTFPRALYYSIISAQAGVALRSDGDLISFLTEMGRIQADYQHIRGALEDVRSKGYGVVMPSAADLQLAEPEIVRKGGRYGVRLKASAKAIHMFQTNIETEVSPEIGGENASSEILGFLLQGFDGDVEQLWQSNIFGKPIYTIAQEGVEEKLSCLPTKAVGKLQETLQRVVNEGSGTLICIIL